MTINELRAFLDKSEKKWSTDDEKYLGPFGLTQVLCTCWKWDEEKQASHFQGWGFDNHLYWDVTGLGLFFDEKDRNSA